MELTPATRERISAVRRALMQVHKAILDEERRDYERDYGRVAPGELLQLLMNDSRFGWFRPVSELIVQLDELLDSEEPRSEEDAQQLLREIRSLLRPTETGEEFGTRYHQAMQQDPAIILAHGEIAKLLKEP
jgi:hypothetical protein